MSEARSKFCSEAAERNPTGVVYPVMSPQELAQLIDDHCDSLVLFARQWSECPEDIVQEAFMKLVQSATRPNDPVAWLFQVVRNRALDELKSRRRRQQREQQVAQSRSWFVEREIDGLDAEQAVQALHHLPDDQREVIIARLWGGLGFNQIAEVADCSVSTAFRRFEAGIAQLRAALGVTCSTKSTSV